MIPLTAREIADATGGTLTGDPDARILGVCTDSRAMKPDSLFIALKGDTHDGHDKIDDAIAGGANILLLHRDVPQTASHTRGDHAARSTQHAAIVVDDTRRAMGQLANYVRTQFTKMCVIAVAGSNGKTGTKHLIHSVLKTRLKGSMSPKSFNNDIGVPLTLFDVQPDDDYVVVEIGTNHPGEVKHLSLMAEPDVAVVTSIGEEHMEFFKTLDGVRRENADIVAGLRDNGLVLINGDDPHLRSFLPTASTFGSSECTYTARDVHTTLDGTSFACDGVSFSLPHIGRHHASNALVAIAIGRHFGLADADIRAGLASASAPEMRMQKRTIGPVVLINDAYNANPTSVRAALETLDEIEWPGRKIVVLGEMRELGDTSEPAHRAIRDLAMSLAASRCFFVGESFRSDANWFPTSADAGVAIAHQLEPGDLVLIKGSRGTRMEKIEQAIEARFNT
jgi:UDP-N-acetylmuramoyl-tripeptide--D-alanyl-D-alanine ligase